MSVAMVDPASDADIENWVNNNGYVDATPPVWSVAYCIQSLAARIRDLKRENASLEYRLDEANQSNIQLFEAYNRLYSEWVEWVPEGYYAKEWMDASRPKASPPGRSKS